MFSFSLVLTLLRARLHVVVLHVGQQLVGDLRQHLLRQNAGSTSSRLVVHHELGDVTSCIVSAGRQNLAVTVQVLHLGEVGTADADDNDRHWRVGGGNDGGLGGVHVVDGTISQDEQDGVLLIRRTELTRCDVIRGTEQRSEQRRSGENHIVDGSLVDRLHAFDALGFCLSTGLQTEAVLHGQELSIVSFHTSSEAEDRICLVSVVRLQDVSHGTEGFLVVIDGHTGVIDVMQRLWGGRISVTAREVDGDGERDLATSIDEVGEGRVVLDVAVVGV